MLSDLIIFPDKSPSVYKLFTIHYLHDKLLNIKPHKTNILENTVVYFKLSMKTIAYFKAMYLNGLHSTLCVEDFYFNQSHAATLLSKMTNSLVKTVHGVIKGPTLC